MPPFKPATPQILTSTAPLIGEDTCGQCKFTQLQPQDVSQVICGGAPPSAIATPAGIVWVRPSMNRGERACGLFQRKPAVLDS